MEKQTLICTNCGHFGKTKRQPKGTLLMELFLWIGFFWMFFLPGIVYTVWMPVARAIAASRAMISSAVRRLSSLFFFIIALLV